MLAPTGTTAARHALRDAEPAVYWTEGREQPEPMPRAASGSADLAVVGGGLTGLWAAILAKRRDPGTDVVLLEAGRIGSGGSTRNGGFLSESLTHGLSHGAHLWPAEIGTLVRLGQENLDAIEEFLREQDIQASLVRNGKTAVATRRHQVAELRAETDLYLEHGYQARFLGMGGVRAGLDSPTYLAGLRLPEAGGLIDPVALTRGLAEAAVRLGVRMHEGSPVRRIVRDRSGLVLRTPHATVHSRQCVLATNVHRAPVGGLSGRILPVWDYLLVTEPLSTRQWDELRWPEREGVTDSDNRFHYYRPTPDGRVLWGGFDSWHYPGGRTGDRLGRRRRPHLLLANNFLRTFPQLAGIRFTHRWGGPIDSTTRLTPVFGTALEGRLAHAVGFSGLGLAASRFGALVALDLLEGQPSERTVLDLVASTPPRYPPPPLRWPLVRYTRYALGRADRRGGRRDPWLRLLDRHGRYLGS